MNHPEPDMSDEVKRFKNRVTPDGDCLLECKPGDVADFVDANDYDALASRLAEAEKSLAAREAECRVKARALDGISAKLAEAERDAVKWRALMACRMRTIGSAKVNEPDDPWTYLTMEFWTGHPDPTDQPWIHEHFEKFIAKAMKAALSPRHQSAEGAEGEGT